MCKCSLNKLPKSFTNQIDILSQHYNLKINDSVIAKKILVNMNYYCIKGYGIAFNVFNSNDGEIVNDSRRGKFVDGTTIEQLYNYFNLDINFKSLLFNAIHIIEKNVRSIFACNFSLKYNLKSVLADNASQYFKDPAKALMNFYNTIGQNYLKFTKNVADQVIWWHVTNYNNDYPLWVLVEYFNLSKLIWFLEQIKDGTVKKQIRSYFDFVDYDEFIKSLFTLKEIRNRISHFNRLVGTKLPPQNQIVSFIDDYITKDNNREIFSFLLLVKKMLKACDFDKWNVFKNKIIDFLNNNPDFASALNAPINWKEILEK